MKRIILLMMMVLLCSGVYAAELPANSRVYELELDGEWDKHVAFVEGKTVIVKEDKSGDWFSTNEQVNSKTIGVSVANVRTESELVTLLSNNIQEDKFYSPFDGINGVTVHTLKEDGTKKSSVKYTTETTADMGSVYSTVIEREIAAAEDKLKEAPKKEVEPAPAAAPATPAPPTSDLPTTFTPGNAPGGLDFKQIDGVNYARLGEKDSTYYKHNPETGEYVAIPPNQKINHNFLGDVSEWDKTDSLTGENNPESEKPKLELAQPTITDQIHTAQAPSNRDAAYFQYQNDVAKVGSTAIVYDDAGNPTGRSFTIRQIKKDGIVVQDDRDPKKTYLVEKTGILGGQYTIYEAIPTKGKDGKEIKGKYQRGEKLEDQSLAEITKQSETNTQIRQYQAARESSGCREDGYGAFEAISSNCGWAYDMATVSSFAAGADSLSELFMTEESLAAWRNNVNNVFSFLEPAGWATKMCEAKIDTPPQGTAYVKLPQGQGVAVAATIAAECAKQTSGFGGDTQYLYKIIGFVKNPAVGLENTTISYQIKVSGPSGSADLLSQKGQLISGETFSMQDRKAFVQLSENHYDQICVHFDNPPEFYASNTVCNKIVCKEIGESGYNKPPSGSSGSKEPKKSSGSSSGSSGGGLFGTI